MQYNTLEEKYVGIVGHVNKLFHITIPMYKYILVKVKLGIVWCVISFNAAVCDIYRYPNPYTRTFIHIHTHLLSPFTAM